MVKKLKVDPNSKLSKLMIKYAISEELARAIGLEAVFMAQQLFEKWKNNFIKQYKKQKLYEKFLIKIENTYLLYGTNFKKVIYLQKRDYKNELHEKVRNSYINPHTYIQMRY